MNRSERINPTLRPTLGGVGLLALALVLCAVIVIAVRGEENGGEGLAAVMRTVEAAPAPVAPARLEAASEPFASIPDDDASGVADSVRIAETATIAAVEVELVVDHSYPGDLTAELVSPAGTVAELYSGDSSPPQQLDAENAPALANLEGETAQGEWWLRVRDESVVDTGTVERWSLAVETEDS